MTTTENTPRTAAQIIREQATADDRFCAFADMAEGLEFPTRTDKGRAAMHKMIQLGANAVEMERLATLYVREMDKVDRILG